LTINDFANDLLFRLKYDNENLEVPIIIVAHSLGGLVFKKSCRCHQDVSAKNVVVRLTC
jgi:predicted alpha/beta hydrolase family esterase